MSDPEAAKQTPAEPEEEKKTQCKDIPWHNILRIWTGISLAGTAISAFLCYSNCGNGSPSFRDYLSTTYVLIMVVLGVLAEIRVGMTSLFRKINWLARFRPRGLFYIVMGSLALNDTAYGIACGIIMMLNGLFHMLFYFLNKKKALIIEMTLLFFLYASNPAELLSMGLEEAAQSGRRLQRGAGEMFSHARESVASSVPSRTAPPAPAPAPTSSSSSGAVRRASPAMPPPPPSQSASRPPPPPPSI
eukprot:TRINITY_DN1894_c0_g1_i1.p1 TRINITY_DN1894_c0_g1~~TRINITY_DN1894_c0_g1_i1.p1  ORF type:complete len:246 (-),score=50.31 TRINITY_DN1894_c0_g1_i1:323-1060(-)